MNKVLLFFVGLGMAAVTTTSNCGLRIMPLNALNSAQVAKDFCETEQRHNDAWLKFEKDLHDGKFDLEGRYKKEKSELAQEEIDAIAKINSVEDADEVIFECFKKTYDLVVKHREECKAFWQNQSKTAQGLYEQFKTEHEKFRQYTKENDFKTLKAK